MKSCIKTIALLLTATAVSVAFYCSSPKQRYDRIEAGMTPTDVERVMGRPADRSSPSLLSHFEEWAVSSEVSLWVEYDEHGRVIGKGLDEIRNSPSGESTIEIERESFLGAVSEASVSESNP